MDSHIYARVFRRGHYRKEEKVDMMVTRVAVMGIIVENLESTEQLNAILHRYSGYILGRMGIPYRDKDINVISIAIDAPQDVTNTMAGEIGALPGVNVKTAFSHVIARS